MFLASALHWGCTSKQFRDPGIAVESVSSLLVIIPSLVTECFTLLATSTA